MTAWTDLTFGVEIECFSDATATELVTALNDAGVPVSQSLSHSGRSSDAWLIKPDGSLHANVRGQTCREIVSPVLQGLEGLEVVRKVADVLRATRHQVNQSCGLHVHIGAAPFQADEVLAIWARYAMHGAAINSSLAPSRRSNQYCRTVAARDAWNTVTQHLPALQTAASRGEIRQALGGYATNRYVAVNLTSLGGGYRPETIEFRQHHGSINAARIIGWIKFVMQFSIESARKARELRNGGASVAAAPIGLAGVRNPIKRTGCEQWRLFEAFRAGRPLTLTELMAVIQESEAHTRQQLAMLRKKIANRTQDCTIVATRGRRGASTEYTLVANSSGAAAQVAGAGIASLVGAPEDGIEAEVMAVRAERTAYYQRLAGTAQAA